ncbi:hypothetical protein NQZ68_014467 [Dissostichus eleginoides]|nr:hypothetical protein NQZ68_014467 [Dissostichus eleginoides]
MAFTTVTVAIDSSFSGPSFCEFYQDLGPWSPIRANANEIRMSYPVDKDAANPPLTENNVRGRRIPVCRGYSPLSCFIVPDNDFPIENDPRDPETDSKTASSSPSGKFSILPAKSCWPHFPAREDLCLPPGQNLPSILQILSLSGAIALGMSIEVRVRASWLQNVNVRRFLKPQCSLAPPMQRGRSGEACSCFTGMCHLHQRRISSGSPPSLHSTPLLSPPPLLQCQCCDQLSRMSCEESMTRMARQMSPDCVIVLQSWSSSCPTTATMTSCCRGGGARRVAVTKQEVSGKPRPGCRIQQQSAELHAAH